MKALLFYRWGLIDSKLLSRLGSQSSSLSSFELYLKLAAAAAGYNKQQTLKWKKETFKPIFFHEPLFPSPEESFKKQTHISGLKKVADAVSSFCQMLSQIKSNGNWNWLH